MYTIVYKKEFGVMAVDQDFRKKLFRGAKIEDVIMELEKLSQLCEEKTKNSQSLERQRFYEGMAIAYTTVALKLKGEFDYIEPKVIDELYHAVEKNLTNTVHTEHVDTCSFCRRSKDEVGELALGPGVSICGECLKFGEEVIKANAHKR
ncbi:ClpX C4-type zinc finger domain-containing protein [Paenibacillus sp. 32O-W]|jgi:ATP-dependent protease Clp, ATPase subunit|uniref:ClpX C4-type zinc finger protein n=1 Tax=Paenibacillus sp. 32O-W TaxID=1695218 RepID=UPI000720202D|nr:ClpX C4-type zinc finger domain-containing protein [Paenibacillus sp. 32O-W]